MSTPTLPAADIIRIWNRIAEDSGTLEATLCRFAHLLLSEVVAQQNDATFTKQGRCER